MGRKKGVRNAVPKKLIHEGLLAHHTRKWDNRIVCFLV